MEGIDLNVPGAIEVLYAHGIECDKATLEQWIANGDLKATKKERSYVINEMDILDFLCDLGNVGTSQEKGIDDKTKIKRMEIEINQLIEEIEKLKGEKMNLESRLGIMPF